MKRPTGAHGECVYLLFVSFPYLCALQVGVVSGELKEDPSAPDREKKHTYVRIFSVTILYSNIHNRVRIKYRSHFCFVGRTVQRVLPNMVVISHNDLSEECRDLHTM